MNVSCIKAIKSAYSAHRGSKTARKKGMNEYLKAEKEAGAYEATERVTRITENLARPWRSVPIYPLLLGVRVRRGHKGNLKLMFRCKENLKQGGSVESEEAEEVAPPLIRNRRSRGPATLEGTKVAERSQPEALLAPLMMSCEGAEAQSGSPGIMMPALKVVEPA